MQTHLYLLSLGLLLPSLAIIIIQIVFRINVVSVNYPFHCTVGLELPASIVSLGYDALLTIMYSAIFMKFYFFPTAAQQTAPHSSSLHMMAKRNAIAAIIASFTICVNYIILLCLNGSERGLVASSSTSLVSLLLLSLLLYTHFMLGSYYYLCRHPLGHYSSSRKSIE